MFKTIAAAGSAAILAAVAAGLVGPLAPAARANDDGFVTYKALTVDTALKAATAAMESCRGAGFQVTVAVVDRGGNLQVLLRDRFAGPLTPDTARGKARTAVSFRTDTLDLVSVTAAGAPQSGARHIPGAIMLGGGVVIESAGAIVGGMGVSGAPSGPNDHACAKAGLNAIADTLAF
ncbi:MAG: heme-binding protein [Rhodobacterales bacterium]|nr:heme-binding protein [Rhodobacterales bacterium]